MRRFKRTYYFSLLTILLDLLSLFISFTLTFYLRFYTAFDVSRGIPTFKSYLTVLPLLLISFIIVFKSFNLYKERRFFEINIRTETTFKAFLLSILVVLLIYYFYRGETYSRLFLALFTPIGFTLLLMFRYSEIKLEILLQKKYLRKSKILIFGTGDDVKKLENSFKKDFSWGFSSIESIDSEKIFQGDKTTDPLESVFKKCKENNINEIIVISRNITHEQMVNIILECEKNMISFHIAPDIFNIITTNVNIINIDGISLLELKRSPLEQLHNRLIKRIMDLTGSFFGIILLSPFMFFVAVLIKKDSEGNIFYKQKRCGEDGKDFTLLKFRTMYTEAESDTGPVFASKDDPRRTKIGKWLRSKNLDELPQLFNVFIGDMSLVGPRPERPHFVEKFKEDIPRYMARHLVKSGITGWAQIHGLRGNTSIEERIKYDLFYIENWSILLDIRILFLSFFSKKNAY
ncbi:MAG: undecaprenyl-phosphate glucose phosphotransferase [Candidatus Aureabacteria bacterium]|nr:undecaprenyl-phosphate glucose phosphotransferase [Candidatus Auribacterota bacterium]